MYIGGGLLEKHIDNGLIEVFTSSGNKEVKIGPNSIDVTLADTFYFMHDVSGVIELDKELPDNVYSEHVFGVNGYVLHPGDFILASVQERFVPEPGLMYIPHYEGRSTMARLGILSHVSAGFGDYGFPGAFTLEIKNLGKAKVRLKAGIRIGQVYFTEVIEPKTYKGYDQCDFKPQLPILGEGRF